jgi:ABC-type phosphate transport system substrate-binding protein
MKKAIITIFALLIILAILDVRLYAQKFKIIVHETNPISSMTRAEVSEIFLKKTKKLNGTDALPVDLVSTNPVRQSFSRYIHRRPFSAIKAYWQQQIFSGRGVPPPEKESDREVVAYVWGNPGAIGYVSASTKTDGVKILKITEN